MPDTRSRNIRNRLGDVFTYLETGLYERGPALRLCMVAAVAGESVFLLGPPGTGKSLLARRLENAFKDARCFDYLMGRFSTPEEIFGPVSINTLKTEDRYIRRTAGYLPDADIAFLDEIWKAGPPIRNALLTALNEKIFRNGDSEIRLPLKLLIAASNEGISDTDEDSQRAFWDRFLVRLIVSPLVDEARFRSMILDTMDPYLDPLPPSEKISPEEWSAWQTMVDSVDLPQETTAMIVDLRTRIARDGINGHPAYVSDRRWKKAVRFVKAAAICNGRKQASLMDSCVLVHCLWDRHEDCGALEDLFFDAFAFAARQAETEAAGLVLRCSEMIDRFRQSLTTVSSEWVEESLIVDDEYLVLDCDRFNGWPELPESGTEGIDARIEIRIWKHDLDDPLPETARIGDLFVFIDGTYLRTIRKRIASAAGPHEVLIDDRTYSLKTVKSEKRIVRVRDLGEDEMRTRAAALQSMKDELAKTGDRLLSRRATLSADLAREFYVHPRVEDCLAGALTDSIVSLGEASAALEREATGPRPGAG